MFKLALCLRDDGASINPFACTYLRSYLRGGVIVVSHETASIVSNNMSNIDISDMVIFGGECSNGIYHHSPDLDTCIRYLSKTFNYREWWFIGDNHSVNQMINTGVIMDIHLAKYYCLDNIDKAIESNIISGSEAFEKSSLDEFQIISTMRCRSHNVKSVQHYLRVNTEEKSILAAMSDIIRTGYLRPNRTKVDTRSLFGRRFEYEMVERLDPKTGKSSYRLPLLTTKRMFVRGVFAELKWFLGGHTNSKLLEEQGVNIWKGNSSREYLDSIGLDYEEGECGPIYGFQWRHYGADWQKGKTSYTGEGIDQVANVIDSLQTDPFSRRHIINGWNPKDLDKMCLPPCHVMYQFLVHVEHGQKYLSITMTQRSCDVFLGLPFNVCSLGMFLAIMAHRVGMKPFKIIHTINDFHLYESHIDAAYKQTLREPCMFPYISIDCEPKDNIEDYNFKDISIDGYHHYDAIQADMVA